MEKTPKGLRRHAAIFGKTNAGKSALFNAILGYDAAIVSPQSGTTTDPVSISMELIPFGPITLIDTAGLQDESELGEQRMQKTADIFRRTDLALLAVDADEYDFTEREMSMEGFRGERLLVFTKCDALSAEQTERLKKQHPDAVLVSCQDTNSIHALKKAMADRLIAIDEPSAPTMIGHLLPRGARIVLVIPIDSGAPAGRLILPQVQLMRDILDHGMKAYITRETELEEALQEIRNVDLVVTDSQAFAYVDQRVPKEIPLTSFSMLLAMQKGNFEQLLSGTRAVESLQDGDTVLVLEGCTHNQTHEDIGRVKIPALIRKKTGKELSFDFYSGYSMPKHVQDYKMAIQCGSCMINRAEIQSRLALFAQNAIPVSNYGLMLAYGSGILDRCCEIFR